jgi:ParB family transcriptional regulator, chromosome partitioning protein
VLDVDAVRTELCEIDENLARSELSDAQRADHHARREVILIRRGEVSKKGDNQHTRASDKLSYAARAASDLGVDERTIQRDLRRGKKIAPEVLAEVTGTDLDKGVVLDELART